MLAKELAEKLMENPDIEVVIGELKELDEGEYSPITEVELQEDDGGQWFCINPIKEYR